MFDTPDIQSIGPSSKNSITDEIYTKQQIFPLEYIKLPEIHWKISL